MLCPASYPRDCLQRSPDSPRAQCRRAHSCFQILVKLTEGHSLLWGRQFILASIDVLHDNGFTRWLKISLVCLLLRELVEEVEAQQKSTLFVPYTLKENVLLGWVSCRDEGYRPSPQVFLHYGDGLSACSFRQKYYKQAPGSNMGKHCAKYRTTVIR